MRKLSWVAGAVILSSTLLSAQRGAAVRLLNAPDATSAHVLAAPATVRQLRSGELLVNDTERRQLLVLNASLQIARVAVDSAGGTMNWYGPRSGGIIPFFGDSTLFIDPVGLTMLVLAPDGAVARAASVPRSQDVAQLAMNGGTMPGLDGSGRLLYRGSMRMPTMAATGMTTGSSPDSMDIDRIDLRTRRVDTAGYFKILKMSVSATQSSAGISVIGTMNPVQMIDDWAVLSDGTLAIVRGLDYHVDFVGSDRVVKAGPKIPFDWRPLTDEAKVALLDSIGRTMSAPGAHGMAAMHGGSGVPMTMKLAAASELPDYYPAFEQNAARADADGNLWVRTTATRAGAVGGPIYDVIDRHGALVDRIQVPAGRRVLGFGAGGVVYLVARDQRGSWIERTHR